MNLMQFFAGLPRQGPGHADDPAWALEAAGVPPGARLCDAGCGSGADAEALLNAAPDAQLLAVDATPELAEAARARLARFGARAEVITGDMAQLPGRYDLIWCAGALYHLGVTEGLSGWLGALAPGGAICFSEPVLPEGAGQAARDFWAEYPAITDLAGLTARIEAAGCREIASRLVGPQGWAAYFGPMEAGLPLADLPEDDRAALAAEIAAWRRAPDQILYRLTLVRPS